VRSSQRPPFLADVGAIVVNYNTGAWLRTLVDGLEREKLTRRDGTPGTIEIVVVENASPANQDAWLAPLQSRGVKVVRSKENLGYAGGCNLGTRYSDARHLLYLNPDVLLVPGCVQALASHLDEHPECGQAGPRGWFDSHRFFYLPRIELPTLSMHLAEAWRRTSPARAEAFALRRTRNALRIWSADHPQEEPVLAGYAFMMPAPFARALGPFDDRFPLYYEDADLSRRVRESGRQCTLVPDSEMVHLFNKSAGQFVAEAMRKHDVSLQRYLDKHYGALGGWIGGVATSWVRRNPTRDGAHEFAKAVDLGALAEPPVLQPTSPAPRYLFELTLDPMFSLAVGRIDTREKFEIPRGAWDHLDPTTYYVRMLSLPDLEPLGAWRFAKTSPAIRIESDADFLARLADSHPPAELARSHGG
jgi:GT2 family glycosyltransferase